MGRKKLVVYFEKGSIQCMLSVSDKGGEGNVEILKSKLEFQGF